MNVVVQAHHGEESISIRILHAQNPIWNPLADMHVYLSSPVSIARDTGCFAGSVLRTHSLR